MTGKTQSIVQNNRVTVENEGQLFQSTETLCNMHRGPMILRGSHVQHNKCIFDQVEESILSKLWHFFPFRPFRFRIPHSLPFLFPTDFLSLICAYFIPCQVGDNGWVNRICCVRKQSASSGFILDLSQASSTSSLSCIDKLLTRHSQVASEKQDYLYQWQVCP